MSEANTIFDLKEKDITNKWKQLIRRQAKKIFFGMLI